MPVPDKKPEHTGRIRTATTGRSAIVRRHRKTKDPGSTLLAFKTVYTTGEVARICGVAPRTVSKWFDSGRLRGFRIPGGEDRRIPREHLIRFMKEYGLPLGELEIALGTRILCVGCCPHLRESLTEAFGSGKELVAAECGFDAGSMLAQGGFRGAIIDLDSVGCRAGQAMAVVMRRDPYLIVFGLARRGKSELDPNVFHDCFRKPVDPALLAAQMGRMWEEQEND